jgi:hypothetical protein
MSTENLAPLSKDLFEPDYKLEIIRGLEHLIRVDKTIADGEVFAEGDWAVLNDNDELEAPSATPVANTYPVWAGNAEGRSDVHATKKATILMGQSFIYKTAKFDANPVYTVGAPITVKDLGAGEMVPTLQSGSEPILGRVVAIPANGVMEIQVL